MEFNYYVINEREVTEIDIDIAMLKDKINKLMSKDITVDQNNPLKIKLKKLQDEKASKSEKDRIEKEREKLDKEAEKQAKENK